VRAYPSSTLPHESIEQESSLRKRPVGPTISVSRMFEAIAQGRTDSEVKVQDNTQWGVPPRWLVICRIARRILDTQWDATGAGLCRQKEMARNNVPSDVAKETGAFRTPSKFRLILQGRTLARGISLLIAPFQSVLTRKAKYLRVLLILALLARSLKGEEPSLEQKTVTVVQLGRGEDNSKLDKWGGEKSRTAKQQVTKGEGSTRMRFRPPH